MDQASVAPPAAKVSKQGIAIIPLVITLAATALAIFMSALFWDAYMAAPWTRDATACTLAHTNS